MRRSTDVVSGGGSVATSLGILEKRSSIYMVLIANAQFGIVI
jgi:hypothetical protein